MAENFTEKSYWLSSRPYQPGPQLGGSTKADVVIIGGGFTGLSTAYYLRCARPQMRVIVLESEVVGYGASGRNGGFAMTLFGLTLGITAMRFGRERAAEAHRYMLSAVDHVGKMVRDLGIDCDYERTGLLVVATSKTWEKRLRKEVELAHSMGLEDLEYWDGQKTRAAVNSPLYLGAKYESACALINPAKFSWGLKAAAEMQGVEVYERTPVTSLDTGSKLIVKTPCGDIEASKVVFATNAFSGLFPQLKSKAFPVYTYIVLTEPLDEARLEPIGWRGRQGIEDGRNLVHYYRLTADNRLLMGGGDVQYYYNGYPGKDRHEQTFRELEKYVGQLFPSLRGARFTHKWGGPVSVPLDMAPALGYLGNDRRVVYSLGCVGHGVALTNMNGKILRDLVLEQESELTRLFFVNRALLPLPPEPLRFAAGSILRAGMRLHDRLSEG
jgi:glycine/D-amino acid oxidase-like deaminating enzyme